MLCAEYFMKEVADSEDIFILSAREPRSKTVCSSSSDHDPISICEQRFSRSGAKAVILEESFQTPTIITLIS